MAMMTQTHSMESTAASAARSGPTAAVPVSFSGTIGLFQPAEPLGKAAKTAVLLLSPWGYEEMCARKFYRALAEDMAAAGVSSLRFDYPGTGDALDPGGDGSLALWKETILAAAKTLRRLADVTELILVGQGLGAALAYDSCADIGHVAGLAMLAPVLSTRAYLRELSVWARMTEGGPQDAQKAEGGLSVSGLTLTDALIADLRAINLGNPASAPAERILVVNRPDRPQDIEFAAQLKALGAQVKTAPYLGYDDLVFNLTFSKSPDAVAATVVAWIASIKPSAKTVPLRSAAKTAGAPVLEGDGFVETPMRFGDDQRLYGILCEPADGIRRGATVILLTTAYERMSGWGRVSTITARDLARAGIPSLRYDAANVADSPPFPGAPRQVLYSDWQHLDVEAAMQLLTERNLLPAVIAGRCSGGYLAFRALARDSRLSGAVCVNPYVFYWDGKTSVEELMLFVPQKMTSYASKALKSDTWKRILRGEVNLKYGVLNTWRKLQKRSLSLVGSLLDVVPALSHERGEVIGAFQTIDARGSGLSLLYSEDDVGLAHLSQHFGRAGEKLGRYPRVRFEIVGDADHAMSAPAARQIYAREIKAMAMMFPPL